MHTATACSFCFAALLALGAACGIAQESKPSKGERESAEAHLREELGVNEFTTPSIAVLLQALRVMRPVPYEKVERDLPAQNPSGRARLALSTGAVIADGFLAVAAEKQSRLEPIGRVLLRQAKGLGVAEHVSRHARSILEKGALKDWDAVRAELAGTQREVEKGMMALKDEEIAHLVALGGWWRGLEIAAGITLDRYTPERAALLVQPGVLDYFADRVGTLHPNFQKTELWKLLDSNLRDARRYIAKEDRSAPTEDEVRQLRALARATTTAIDATP